MDETVGLLADDSHNSTSASTSTHFSSDYNSSSSSGGSGGGLTVSVPPSSSSISTINKELAEAPRTRPSIARPSTDPRSPPRSRKPQIQRLMSDSMAAVSNSSLNKLTLPGSGSGPASSSSGGGGGGGSGPGSGRLSKPALSRTMSTRGAMEASRSALAAMISQIQDLDPHPCIFGIPVMPALFRYSKFYLFLFFAVVGCRSMLVVFRDIL
jgi:hypothetical protein